VILVDVNLLVYAYNDRAEQHSAARRWLESAFSGSHEIALPWAVLHAFLRLTTSQRVMPVPLSTQEAMAVIEEWRLHVLVLEPGPRYWIFRELMNGANVRGDLVSDAHLAALAIEHDATLYTADSDFRRFAGLRVVNPLRA
jgi:toxin-antitoxin system PIN domain toxin